MSEVPSRVDGAPRFFPSSLRRHRPQLPMAESDVPRRTPTLHNTLRLSQGGAQLVVPDQTVMTQIAAASQDRVQYWPTSDAFTEYAEHSLKAYGYATYILEPLVRHIAEHHRGKQLAFRAIETSINGTFPGRDGDYTLLDVTQTASNGQEKPGGIIFNVAKLPAVDPDDPSFSIIPIDRVVQYASEAGRYGHDDPDRADATFPALLAYDAGGIQSPQHIEKHHRPSPYAVEFRPGVDPRTVLLGTYVLDAERANL